eukprot:15484530-Alexandrium_andersonii.AAC.1
MKRGVAAWPAERRRAKQGTSEARVAVGVFGNASCVLLFRTVRGLGPRLLCFCRGAPLSC